MRDFVVGVFVLAYFVIRFVLLVVVSVVFVPITFVIALVAYPFRRDEEFEVFGFAIIDAILGRLDDVASAVEARISGRRRRATNIDALRPRD